MRLLALTSLAALLLAAGSPAWAGAPASKGEKKAVALRFRWPVPGKVVVVEKTRKQGNTVKLRYVLELSRFEAGSTDLRLRFTDFDFLEVNGQDARTPAMRKQMAAARAISGAIPDLRIASSGKVKDVVDLEGTLKRVVDVLEKTGEVPAGRIKALRGLLNRPQVRETVRRSSLEFWFAWVGYWAGLELRPGGEVKLDDRYVALLGLNAPRNGTLKMEAPPRGRPGAVRLRLRSKLDGLQGRKTFLAAMKKLAAADPSARPPDRDRLLKFERDLEIDAVLDPATLRPHTVELKKDTRIELKGLPPKTEVERRSYTFEWKK